MLLPLSLDAFVEFSEIRECLLCRTTLLNDIHLDSRQHTHTAARMIFHEDLSGQYVVIDL
jgi:hypothetical protein